MKVTQELVDSIVARARGNAFGLNPPEPGKGYNIDMYEPPNLQSLAMLLVGAHFEKYDIVSLFWAAMEEIEKRMAEARKDAPP